MNAEVKKAWVAALRSGEYKQGTGCLQDGDESCCLGVLCDLAVKAGTIARFNGELSYPPEIVRLWAGLERCDPYVKGKSLSLYNDGDEGYNKHSFTEIADLIEKYL